MKKRMMICGGAFAMAALLLVFFALGSGAIRQKRTVRSFAEHRDLFEEAIELYDPEALEQGEAFFWERGDMEEDCPEEIRELLEQTGFQGIQDWSGYVCFYKGKNDAISYGILYVPGNGAVSRAPFYQLDHIGGPWYYYAMDDPWMMVQSNYGVSPCGQETRGRC